MAPVASEISGVRQLLLPHTIVPTRRNVTQARETMWKFWRPTLTEFPSTRMHFQRTHVGRTWKEALVFGCVHPVFMAVSPKMSVFRDATASIIRAMTLMMEAARTSETSVNFYQLHGATTIFQSEVVLVFSSAAPSRNFKLLIRPMMDYSCPIWRSATHSRVPNLQVLQSKCLRIAISASWYIINRQSHVDLGIPLFADHIGALAESFDSKLAVAGNLLVRQLGRHLCPPEQDSAYLRIKMRNKHIASAIPVGTFWLWLRKENKVGSILIEGLALAL
ncbi:RNA-directed DNA polymerase from mobile element jockey [Zootermopsis nevadensis]|uniref:RNA-directed DNA polymerase from mobile element jockey n=1 Tax=Zootermopsis nevadensis TaxID=136037 RepID=A0A067RCC3_ZOONE|nr:RNA-directed DNA polymerase from mobile element jockey [Zootermopsis nevadensis]